VLEPAQLVPLRNVRINLEKHLFPGGNERRLVRSEFQLYHRAVLRKPGKSLGDDVVSAIITNANNAKVEPGQIILAALLAHRRGNEEGKEDRPFYPSALAGPSSLRHLAFYREECARRYGTFDASLLGDVAQLPSNHNISKRLRDSEELASRWAIDSYLGGAENLYSLYEQREIALDPWWLATEPSYLRWVGRLAERDADELAQVEDAKDFEMMRSGMHALKRHRHRAVIASKQPAFPAVVSMRSKLVVQVALIQATHFGLSHSVLVPPVYDKPTGLWHAIARTIIASRKPI